jgi:sec-independent protein translocase protein TatA
MLPFAVFGLGPLELIIIIAIVIILFMPALLPKLARRLGETVSTLKDMANKGIDEDGTEPAKEPVAKTKSPQDNGDSA